MTTGAIPTIIGFLGDTGYLLVGPFGGGVTAEGGLLWSPRFGIYEVYGKDNTNDPDSPPRSMSFLPDLFAMTFTMSLTTWSISVTTFSGASATWIHPGTSTISTATSWTYKQATTIGQNQLAPTSGSYFGVDSNDFPLFAWSHAPSGSDFFPDSTRGLQFGDNYGIDLHQ
ncbi:MAG TPA: hypothetical protein VGC72_01900 [Candidatus Elarobacter sp.]|jgi:hypothetical protein